MSLEQFYTLQELAKLLHISLSQIRKLLDSGVVRGIRVGRGWRIPESQVSVLLANADPAEATQVQKHYIEKNLRKLQDARVVSANRQKWCFRPNYTVKMKTKERLLQSLEEAFLICSMVGPLTDLETETIVAAARRLGDGAEQQLVRKRVRAAEVSGNPLARDLAMVDAADLIKASGESIDLTDVNRSAVRALDLPRSEMEYDDGLDARTYGPREPNAAGGRP